MLGARTLLGFLFWWATILLAGRHWLFDGTINILMRGRQGGRIFPDGINKEYRSFWVSYLAFCVASVVANMFIIRMQSETCQSIDPSLWAHFL